MALTDTTNSTASTRADLEKKTVPELKTLCKAAGCPMTGAKGVLVGYLLDPANNQKGKRKAAGGASGGQSKAAKAARAMAGPWSATEEPGVDPAQAEPWWQDAMARLQGATSLWSNARRDDSAR